MNKTIDMAEKLLEKNNIPLLDGTKEKDGGLNSKNKERCHALVARYSSSSSFIIASGSSRHMSSTQESFSALHPYSGPSILMGDHSEIPAKGIGRINLDNGYFKNVLHRHDLEANLISIYQMEHTRSAKRVKFTQYDVEIS